MTENNENKSELKKGLFGATDRVNGEYHFKSGDVERIYSDAHYVPYGEEAVPPRYYQPEHSKPRARRKKGMGFIGVAILCISCAVLGGAIGAGLMTAYFDNRVNEVENSVKSLSDSAASTAQLQSDDGVPISNVSSDNADATTLSSEDLYKLSDEQVVSITTEYTNNYNMAGIVTGSGVVASSDGLILTNFHVVEKAYIGGYSVDVAFQNGDEYNGQVVAVDAINDLAVVKIDAENLNAASLAYDEPVIGGAEVTIAGNPYGMFTVSSGKISNPSVDVDAEDNGNAINMFQLDVTVYEGNSGGPVYNNKGEVIGIVTAKVSADSSDGIGFAIPISTAQSLFENMTSTGVVQAASLGVEFFQNYDEMFMAYYSYPEGAFVEQVNQGSCAERAGIAVGDVIREIDGHTISSYQDAENVLRLYRSGDQVDIVLFREGRYYSATITLD